ncbi:hypothetical protein B0H21DRAFT_691270 [Amylocystis lapponica]|nr:hypothetical protein B0H21DRAFT_691270 [Amylocystis lapponica]
MPRRAKSTLAHHRFPPFYACYLLKSIRTPRSTATYIGSTPSPPRRIRQHNGEIAQGAWKTKHNRPWVMQMVVHGFPSKLSALQFEWAWQHPHLSRHLRTADGGSVLDGKRRTKSLKANVTVARSMVSSHPYNTWPLHVKLFTSAAVNAWADASAVPHMPRLPDGFTCATELEGVDAKSGHAGSGRTVPIDVTDSQFTSAHLHKASALLAAHVRLHCSLCTASLPSHPPDPLATALCPAPGCSAVSHLTCLARDFLAAHAQPGALIPRGGRCRACGAYTLWGDVVRGCDRRSGGAVPDPDPESDAEDEAEADTERSVSACGADEGDRRRVSEGEGEVFDLDAVSSSSDDARARAGQKPRSRREGAIVRALSTLSVSSCQGRASPASAGVREVVDVSE